MQTHITIIEVKSEDRSKYNLIGDGIINRKAQFEGYNNGQAQNASDFVIIMDLDGTLIDSDVTNFKLLHKLLKKFNFEDKIEIIMNGLAKGTHYNEIMKEIGMPEEIRKKMDSEMTNLLSDQNYKLLSGARSALESLKQEGYKFALVTDNYLETTIKFLKINNILQHFNEDLIIASDNFAYQKPHKNVIQEIFKRTRTNKGILIGNSSKEIDFAKKSELPIILLDNFSNPDSNDPLIINYQKIRQLDEKETYRKIYKSKSWLDILNIIQQIMKKDD